MMDSKDGAEERQIESDQCLSTTQKCHGTNLMDFTFKSGTWGLMMVDDDFVS